MLFSLPPRTIRPARGPDRRGPHAAAGGRARAAVAHARRVAVGAGVGQAQDLRAAALRETARLLAEHGLEQVVAVERDDQPPEKTKGGKFRAVVPLED